MSKARPAVEDVVLYPNHDFVGKNVFLDTTLKLHRGGEPVKLYPTMAMANCPEGYLHFSIPTIVAEEAAWWALEEEHAVPASMTINLLRPAHVLGGAIIGYGEQIRKGKSVLTACGSAMQGGKQIALVVVTFIRFEKH